MCARSRIQLCHVLFQEIPASFRCRACRCKFKPKSQNNRRHREFVVQVLREISCGVDFGREDWLGVGAYLLLEAVFFLGRDLENAREEVGMVRLKSNSGRRRVKERRRAEEGGGWPRFYLLRRPMWPNAHPQAVSTFDSAFSTGKTPRAIQTDQPKRRLSATLEGSSKDGGMWGAGTHAVRAFFGDNWGLQVSLLNIH